MLRIVSAAVMVGTMFLVGVGGGGAHAFTSPNTSPSPGSTNTQTANSNLPAWCCPDYNGDYDDGFLNRPENDNPQPPTVPPGGPGTPGSPGSTGGNATTFGPFASETTDGSNCYDESGNQIIWADDTFNRTFTVMQNRDGTFTVAERITNGHFTTRDGVSPNACNPSPTGHGTHVNGGIMGTFNGFLQGTVTSTMYDPNACNNDPTSCNTVDGFITTTFGPNAYFTCDYGYQGCQFNFVYVSPDPTLIYRRYQDYSPLNGPETLTGDIANF